MFRTSESFGNNAFNPTQHSKFIVTKRSWQANVMWAKFPKFFPRPKQTSVELSDKASPVAAWVGDLVDQHSPLRVASADHVDSDRATSCAFPSEHALEHHTDLSKFLDVHGFRWHQLIIFCISIFCYLGDVISDAYLVYTYYKQGDYYWSILTMVLMVVPAFLMTSVSLVWYLLDRKLQVDPPRTWSVWTLRILFHGFLVAPIVRSADSVYYGIVSRKSGIDLLTAVRYTQLMLYEDVDCAMLRMIECFTESAPQLLLQFYIILSQESSRYKFQGIAQAVSCIFSWLSLAWSLTYYQSALRSSRVEKANITWIGGLFFFLWKAGMLASRLLALAMFAVVVHGLWFGVIFTAHWLFASLWLMVRGTTFCSTESRTLVELTFDLVLGAVYCFDVVNIKEGHSRIWYTSCYIIIGLENCSFAFLWWIFLPDGRESLINKNWSVLSANGTSNWLNQLPTHTLPVIVVCVFFFGVSMMITYYLVAHPSGQIKVCVPCSDLLNDCETTSPSNDISLDYRATPLINGSTRFVDCDHQICANESNQ